MMEILDDLADPAQQAALLGHTAECAACRAEWQALQRLDALLSTAPMAMPPAGFTHRVLTRLRQTLSEPALTSLELTQTTSSGGQHSIRERDVVFSDVGASQGWDELYRRANPLGGIAVLLLGTLLVFTIIASPLLQRAWPMVWKLLTEPGTSGTGQLVNHPLLLGISETIQAIWRLHRSILQSVGPLLLAGYFTVTLMITLFWLRLVTGMQQALSIRK